MQQTDPPERALADFVVFLDGCQRPLYTFLRGLVRDEEQARDLMQDAFCDAWKVACRGQAPFTGLERADEQRRWLFHAAYNRAISAFRRRKLIRWLSLEQTEGVDLELSRFSGSFEERLAESEAVRAALERLVPEDRACLILIVVYGFTAVEAGRIMGASVPSVRKRFARARKRLRALYLAQDPASERGAGFENEKKRSTHVHKELFSG